MLNEQSDECASRETVRLATIQSDAKRAEEALLAKERAITERFELLEKRIEALEGRNYQPDENALEELEAKLKATQEALDARPETVEPDFEPAPKPEPPAEVAELLREGHSMGDAANELARRWAEFANLRQLNQELTPEQLAKEKRLQKALNWFQGDHSIEVI